MQRMNVTMSGTVLDQKTTTKGKPYIKLYDGESVHNIFGVSEDVQLVAPGESIELPVTISINQDDKGLNVFVQQQKK